MRRLRWLSVAALLLAGLASPPAAAQDFSSVAYNVFSADVTVTTTTETVIVSSDPATTRRAAGNVCIIAWVQHTTGAATTTVTPRIRRGTAASGTLVGEANAVTIGAAAGSTEQYMVFTCEDRGDVGSVTYSLTLQQAGATGNGAALQGGILVMVR